MRHLSRVVALVLVGVLLVASVTFVVAAKKPVTPSWGSPIPEIVTMCGPNDGDADELGDGNS